MGILTNNFRLFTKTKDGGPESHVWAYWLLGWKGLFSVVLLRFEDGSRNAFHSHAFNSCSWLLSGELEEHRLRGTGNQVFVWTPSLWPIITKRETFHKVTSFGRSWVLSFRGPWSDTWQEYDPKAFKYTTLTHGRKVVGP